MDVYIPYHPDDPKTRLDPVMSKEEREEVARLMLSDVHAAVEEAGQSPVVLATRELIDHDRGYDVDVAPEELTPAVNGLLERTNPPVAVVVSDLPLLDSDAVERLLSSDADVSLARGLAGGTNAFVAREDGFRVDYHGASYIDHLKVAEEAGLTVEEVDSYRLAVDVDRLEDIVEVLLHGDGRTADFLRERFDVVEDGESRVSVERTP